MIMYNMFLYLHTVHGRLHFRYILVHRWYEVNNRTYIDVTFEQETAVKEEGKGPSRNKVVVPTRQATQPGGIGSLESILGLLKSLKIRALIIKETPGVGE